MSDRTRKSAISRRALLGAGAAVGVMPSLRAFAQSSEPLRIGFLTVKTGPLAAGGAQQEEGAALFLKERNSVFAGYLLGAALMIAAAIVAWRYAVAAERKSLEQIARPLAFME